MLPDRFLWSRAPRPVYDPLSVGLLSLGVNAISGISQANQARKTATRQAEQQGQQAEFRNQQAMAKAAKLRKQTQQETARARARAAAGGGNPFTGSNAVISANMAAEGERQAANIEHGGDFAFDMAKAEADSYESNARQKAQRDIFSTVTNAGFQGYNQINSTSRQ